GAPGLRNTPMRGTLRPGFRPTAILRCMSGCSAKRRKRVSRYTDCTRAHAASESSQLAAWPSSLQSYFCVNRQVIGWKKTVTKRSDGGMFEDIHLVVGEDIIDTPAVGRHFHFKPAVGKFGSRVGQFGCLKSVRQE